MSRSRQKFAFAQRGAAVMLAATLTAGMVPTMALAQGEGGDAATATAAAATGDGFSLVEGAPYPVSASWLKVGSSDASMMAQYFSSSATVTYAGGVYSVEVSTAKNPEMVGSITYSGGVATVVSTVGDVKTYRLALSSLENVTLQVEVVPMSTSMPTVLSLDTSKLPTAPETPEVTVDKSKLEAAITAAKAIEQGKKTAEAWDTLQAAIATAEKALGNANIPQPGVDAVTATLNTAVQTFSDSADATTDPEPGVSYTTVNATWYLVHNGVQDEAASATPEKNFGKTVQYAKNNDGTYTLLLTAKGVAGISFWMSLDNGTKNSGTAVGDGSYTYSFVVDSIEEAVNLQFGYTAGAYQGSHDTNLYLGKEAATVDKAKLEVAIIAAKAIEQGKKTAEAFKTLQTAIAAAETARDKEGAVQADIDAAATTLGQAVEAFNASADVAQGNQHDMVVGKTYTASVSYAGTGSFAGMDAMLQQMVGKYFGSVVELNLLDDGTYDMVVYFGGSTGYDEAIGDLTYNGQAVKQSAKKTYTINVPSLESAVGLSLHVGGTMNMDITYATTIDTSTIALKDGETPEVTVDKSALQSLVDQAAALTQGKKSDAAWESFQGTLSAARAVLGNANASQDAVNEAATSLKAAIDRFNASENVSFQVGHTYEVPMALFKQGSVTEKSMAAQYFGDTALVRPQENGTFTVIFAATAQGLGYIKSLSYQGAAISQSGDQFTLSIPAAESDTVIPIDMSITMMEQLGIGQSQVADLHLYLSQAKDLGTGQTTKAASSTSSLAKTGDPLRGAATTATGLALAGAAAVAVAARRRMSQQK